MSQYEGWSNRETFMVASLIDNDSIFLDHIMATVASYIVNNMEPQLPSRLAFIVLSEHTARKQNAEAEAKDCLLVMIRLRSELHHLILETFFDQVDWDELAEHYKTKYVENLINDKEIFPDSPKSNS